MEHVIVTFLAHFLTLINRLFQERLRNAIPQIDDLYQNPVEYLGKNEITIGPLRQFLIAAAAGIGVTAAVWCVVAFCRAERPRPNAGPESRQEMAVIIAGLFIVGMCTAVLSERMFRGGRVKIRRNGVVFQHGSNSVFVPWFAFQGTMPSLSVQEFRINAIKWIAINSLVLSRRGVVKATGAQVRTPQLTVAEDGSILFENLYAVPLGEILELLIYLGRRLGPVSPLVHSPKLGERTPEELA